jgi:hypothetical protein
LWSRDVHRPAFSGAASCRRCDLGSRNSGFKKKQRRNILRSWLRSRKTGPGEGIEPSRAYPVVRSRDLDAGWRLHLRCAWGRREGMKSVRECKGRLFSDLLTLVWTRGRDYPIARLEGRLKCPACGSRRVLVAFIPPSEPARVSA